MRERMAVQTTSSHWLDYLLPRDETNAAFREELSRLAVTGLRAIAAISIGGSLLWLAVGFVWLREIVRMVGLGYVVAVFVLGVIALGMSFWPRIHRWARELGLVSAYLLGVFDTLAATNLDVTTMELLAWINASFIMVLLVAIAALPVKPLQVLALSLALTATYVLELRMAGIGSQVAGVPAMHVLLLSMMVPIAIALTAIVYHQRASAYHARRASQLALEELQAARVRVCVSEHAASQGRFAAALSHELNSPLGALASAFDTVVQVHQREKLQLARRVDLEDVFDRAAASGRQATKRLRELVGRIKHVTNLDQAEEGTVDINELWKDTVALLSSELEPKASIRMDLTPLPLLACRPQQLSAVFSNLLRNSAAAMERKGTILISTDYRANDILVEVQDSGKGMSRQQLEGLFDLGFHVGEGRIAAANWGLFMARSIVTEHGGHIEFDSKQGKGTTVRVVLPVQQEPHPEGCPCSDHPSQNAALEATKTAIC